MRKIIALLLSLAMLFSLCTTISFGDDIEVVPITESSIQYSRYVAFGDSMTRGTGIDENADAKARNPLYRNVYNIYGDAAYPYLVSMAVDCKANDKYYESWQTQPFYNVSNNGLTLAAVMDILGLEKYPSEYVLDNVFDYYYQDTATMFGNNETKTKKYEHTNVSLFEEYSNQASYINLPTDTNLPTVGSGVVDFIENAEGSDEKKPILITANLGLADVVLEPLARFALDVQNHKYDNVAFSDAYFVNELAESFDYWKTTYPKFVEALYEMNHDVDIALIGYSNPFEGFRLDDNLVLEIGNIVKPFIMAMNDVVKQIAKDYDYCIYVDTNNAESNIDEFKLTLDDLWDYSNLELVWATHLSGNAHRYVARQIVKAVENHYDKPVVSKYNQYNIVVDLGREEFAGRDIDIKVTINGLEVPARLEGTVLYVENINPYAVTMNVIVYSCYYNEANSSWEDALFSYVLNWEEDHFEACRVYSTNSIDDTVDTVVDNTKAVVDTAIEVAVDVATFPLEVTDAVIDRVLDAREGNSVGEREAELWNAFWYGAEHVGEAFVCGASNVAKDIACFNYGKAACDFGCMLDKVAYAVEDALIAGDDSGIGVITATVNLWEAAGNAWNDFWGNDN
ncbi:MAG: hypothetical protein MJ148_00190 [Clostridia bacterium]|nr:hypothetical protein [Clostridia bacterium]